MKGKETIRWLCPAEGKLHARWRLAVAMVANIALAAHVLPRREHLWDIRDYRYVQVEATWVFVIVALPSVMLLLLLPVVISGNVIRRWLAVSLAVFPGFLAAAGWMQLFLVWAGSR